MLDFSENSKETPIQLRAHLFCFPPFIHYTLLKLPPCYKQKGKCLEGKRRKRKERKKNRKGESHYSRERRLLQLLRTAFPSATTKFAIEFDKILAETSLPYYPSSPAPKAATS